MGNAGYLLETTGRPLNLSGRSCGRSFSGDGSNEMIGTGLLVCWSECVTQEGQLLIPIVADYNLARGDSDRSVCCASAHPRLRRSKLIFLMWILAIRWSFIYILMRLTLSRENYICARREKRGQRNKNKKCHRQPKSMPRVKCAPGFLNHINCYRYNHAGQLTLSDRRLTNRDTHTTTVLLLHSQSSFIQLTP